MGLVRKAATGVVKNDDDYIWDNLKAGDYECRLAYVADLGLQAKDYKGDFKGNFQQLCLGVEVIGEGVEDKDKVMQPRILWSKPFYIYDSLTEKGTEMAFYSIFDASAVEGDVPNWEKQLGKPLSVTVESVQGKGANSDKTYDNVKELNKIPDKYQSGVGVAIGGTGIGDSDDPKNVVTKGLFGLPKFIFDRRIIEDVESNVPRTVPQDDATIVDAAPADVDDDIPF